MMSELTQRFLSLGFLAVIVVLVWGYYRSRTSSPIMRYRTFGPRFWAGAVDSCVMWPVSVAATLVLSSDVPGSVAAVAVVLQSLVWLVYTVVMHARRGQTVGKMVTKVKVVDNRTGGQISWWQAWLREGIPLVLSLGVVVWQVVLILDGSLSYGTSAGLEPVVRGGTYWMLSSVYILWFAAEVLTMLTNEKRRALHDFIAGTVVVRTNLEAEEAAEGAEPEGESAISRMSRRTQGWRVDNLDS